MPVDLIPCPAFFLPDNFMPLSPLTPWYRQLAARIGVLSPLKAVGTTVFMVLFFWGYFAVLRNPLTTPLLMPLTAADEWVAFTPLAYPVYVSLWVYVSLPPALFNSLRPLILFGVWIAALCLFCLGVFWLLPTAVPPALIDWEQYPEMAMIKGIDAAGNACPSLHVASAVFSAIWLDRIFRRVSAPRALRMFSALHCLAILWSTVATRQHVVLDVLAGVVVGLIFALFSVRHIEGVAGKSGI